MLVDLVVQRGELGEPLSEHLRLSNRGTAKLPLWRVSRGHLHEPRRERTGQSGEGAAAWGRRL